MKAPLIEALKLKVRGVLPQERLAAMIVLGMELRHLKVALGYMGGGCHQAYRGQVRPVWDKVCQAQAGFSEATERYQHQNAIVVKSRLARKGTAEALEILAMMDKRPSELVDDDRQRLVNGIMRHALTEGDNQETLRREFRQSRVEEEAESESPAFPRGNEVCHSESIPTPEQMQEMKALAMGCGIGEARADDIVTKFFTRRNARLLARMWRETPRKDDDSARGRERRGRW